MPIKTKNEILRESNGKLNESFAQELFTTHNEIIMKRKTKEQYKLNRETVKKVLTAFGLTIPLSFSFSALLTFVLVRNYPGFQG